MSSNAYVNPSSKYPAQGRRSRESSVEKTFGYGGIGTASSHKNDKDEAMSFGDTINNASGKDFDRANMNISSTLPGTLQGQLSSRI